MNKYLLTFITVFLLSFSIQAQRGQNSSDNRQVFQGIVKTLIFEGEQSTQRQFLDTGKRLIPMFLENDNLLNTKVSITGKMNSEESIVPDKITVLEQPKVIADVSVTGLRSTLVLLINFANDNSQPASVEQVRNVVFTNSYSTNAQYRQASDYKMWLGGRQRTDGDVVGYITIPYINVCDIQLMMNEWTQAANTAAINQGYNPSVYNSVIYVFANLSNSGCFIRGFASLGAVGGDNTERVWLPTALNQTLYTHEIGHNLGLGHSNAASRCSSTQPVLNCERFYEYGDPYDPMGVGGGLFNNYNRLLLGWYSGRMVTYDSPGTYYVNLYAPSRPAKGATIVKIPLKDSNGNLIGSALYLEFRRNAPLFDNFNTPNEIYAARRVSIRLWLNSINPPIQGHTPVLIDTTPTTDLLLDAPLSTGNTFSNSYHGFSITTIGTNPMRGARVKIELTR